MSFAKFIILAIIIAAVALIVSRELQQDTVTLYKSIMIKNKSRRTIFSFLSDPESLSKIHPFSAGISSVVRHKDNKGYSCINYVQHDVVPIYGIYDMRLDIPVNMTVLEQDALIRNELIANSILHVVQHWELSDSPDGHGTEVVDRMEMSSYRLIVRFAHGEADKAHEVLIQRLKSTLESRT